MEKSILEVMAEKLNTPETHKQYAALIENKEKLQEIEKKGAEEIFGALQLLSEFGRIRPLVDKIRKCTQEIKENPPPQDEPQKPLQYRAQISADEMIEIYQISYTLFTEEQWDKASSIAFLLACLNPYISSFWRMIGSCDWKKGNAQSALCPFLYAASIDPLDVDNHLAALDCLIKLGYAQQTLDYYHLAKEALTKASLWDEVKQLDSRIATL